MLRRPGRLAEGSSSWRSMEVPVFEERVDLSNDMTWRQMIAVGVRRVVLARGELDKLEGPKYAARRAELRRKAREAARTRERQAASSSQNEAEESDATEEEATRERTTRVGRPRGGMIGCHRAQKKKGKKKWVNPDRSTSCWRVEKFRV